MGPFRVAVAALSVLALGSCAAVTTPAVKEIPAIDAARIKAGIDVLASDAFEGRGPASAGEAKTIAYIADAMKAAGLQPGGPDGSWVQKFQLIKFSADMSSSMVVSGSDGTKTYRQGTEIVIGTRHVTDEISFADAPLVFAGYGVVAPEQGWNDYAGVDWRGKIAVVLSNDPDFDADLGGAFGGKAMTYYGRWTYKYEEAARQGALGLLIIHEDEPAAYGWGVVRNSFMAHRYDFSRADKGASLTPVEGWLSLDATKDLAKRAGLDLETLKAAAKKRGFTPIALTGLNANVRMPLKHTEITTHNVLGVLPGAVAPQESILLGAHYDHLGIGEEVNGDRLYNGAVDNASGVSAMLEIARTMAAGPKPRRTVVFASWGAEEIGLLGSGYYAENPTVDLTRMAAGFNLDGLALAGKTRNAVVVGKGKTTLEDMYDVGAATQGRRMEGEANPERGSFYRSDHFNFAKKGVPVIYAKSGNDLVNGGIAAGEAADRDYIVNRYHKPQDEIDPNWNFDGAVEELTLLRVLMVEIATSNYWPTWKPGSEFGPLREQSEAARRY
jgi:Zn-dependent M28 family amino/carboxypeptidase